MRRRTVNRTRQALADGLNAAALWLVDAVLAPASRRTYRHLDRIPATGGAVVVCNHISLADPLVFAAGLRRAGHRPTFLGMAELFRIPVLGRLFALMGHVPVERGTAGAGTALAPAVRALRAGALVGLYPEGRITTEPDYRPMSTVRTGAARLALDAGVPVVPVAQWGAHRLLTREHESTWTRAPRLFGWLRPGRLPRRAGITMVVGEPITVAELRAAATRPGSDRLDHRAATDLIMSRVNALLSEIAGDDLTTDTDWQAAA
jgi:1-acyl-sn-glycerol-3-phosphate acyltransferase